jgi:PPK2 family polyphosphate:nucleotide phosphotransferase
MSKQKINLRKISSLPPDSITEENARKKCEEWAEKLADIQQKLFAQRQFAVLVVIQGMDASGKDGAVKHVFSGLNPAGCRVKSFKVPTEEEAGHDFLWRIHRECPEKGMIQIFNRSHYEDILVPTVHRLANKDELEFRLKAIHHFEDLLEKSGTILVKFYLHVSEKEQLARINERKTDPHKRWKYQKADIIETRHREAYLDVYQDLIGNPGTVPWEIVPADKNWYKNYCLLKSILEKLESFPIHFPHVELED